MKKVLVVFLTLFFYQSIYAQANSTIIYYSPVNMPATLKNNYYALFDTKLLAEDLAALLSKSTGEIFSTGVYQPGMKKGIFLLLDSNASINGNETGLVESDGKNFIRVTARYTTGISYAMYSWLEEMGFHFYLPGEEWTIIPSMKTVFNNKIYKKTFKPYFHMRMFGSSGGSSYVKGLDEKGQITNEWKQWCLRNRMGCDYLRVDGHMGQSFNAANRKEIERDSMILAPIQGKRQYSAGGKLDPTYKKGMTLFSDWIIDQYKKEQASLPSFLPFKKYYSVDPGDGYGYCHSPECERQFKTVADQVISIANETAKKIRLVNPDAGISTLAYTEHADTPSIKIEPNVHVMIVAGAYQSVSTAAGLVQAWKHKMNNISLYEFLNIGVWSYDKPFFNLYQYYQYLEFLKTIGIEGIMFETSFSKFGSGILQYFILKYLCDPYTSIEETLDEFCKNNFGNAANPVKKLFKEWYFSNVHLRTNYDTPCFYEDELGRFIQYITEAENCPGLSAATKKRIEELKAYIIYLCKNYELFCELKSLKDYATNPSHKTEKIEEILTYTWKLYSTKIFHSTQLNEMLKAKLDNKLKEKWNYNKSDHYNTLARDAPATVKTEFEKLRKKYRPLAAAFYNITDAFLEANTKYSADSIRFCTIDETGFGKFIYPVEFYCATPGPLKVFYQADSSKIKDKKDKVAMIAVESNDYSFINNNTIIKENSNGTIIFQLPAKGHYRLYLSQYNATHICYVIYPGKNLFYQNKKSLLMNGLVMQDADKKQPYPNKYIAFYAPPVDSIFFSNLYYSATNTSDLYTESGEPIPVTENLLTFYNSAAVPKNQQTNFIFYENSLFRWPPVLKNAAPYYFFLKFPLKK